MIKYIKAYILRRATRKIVYNVILEDDFRNREYDLETFAAQCEKLHNSKFLQFLLLKIKRHLIMRLTKTNVTNLTKEEDSFYRGGLYAIRNFERMLKYGIIDKEIEDLRNDNLNK